VVLLPPGWEAAHAPVANVFSGCGPSLAWWGAAAVLLAVGLVLAAKAPRWALAAAVLAALVLGVAGNGLVDDAYIQFRYAENLAAGHGMVFNPGEHIEGASGGVWIAALAVGPLLGVNAGVWGRVLSLGLTGLATLLAGAAVRRIAGPLAGAYAALLWAALPTNAMYAATGLETAAYGLLLWLALLAATARLPRGGWLAGVGVSALRPEGLVLGMAALPWIRRTPRPLRAVVLGVLGGAAAIAAARLLYFGAALPHSVTIKGFTAAAGVGDGIHYLARALVEWWPLLVGVPVLWRYRRTLWPAIAAAGTWTVLVVARGGDWMPGSRYLLPLMALLVGAAAVRAGDRFGRWSAPALATWGCFLLAPLPDPAAVVPGRLWRAMETERVQSAWWEGLGAFLRGAVPAGTTLASGPAGALPFASGLPTFDMYGLCSVVTHANTVGQTGHRLWGLDAASRRADVIYVGQLLPQNGDVRALLVAAERSVAGVERFRERYRPVVVLHRPERTLDIVADVVWVRQAMRLREDAAMPSGITLRGP
jgi:arabinofuranosyltransferase